MKLVLTLLLLASTNAFGAVGFTMASSSFVGNVLTPAGGGGGGGGTWSSGINGGNEASIENGERGIKITVGAADVVVTKLGCWFSSGTYANMPMKIRDSGCSVVASGTILVAGSTVDAYNFITLASTYTMTASGTYYIVADVSGYNGFHLGGTETVNSVVAYVQSSDATCADPGGDWAGGINFQYSSP